LKDTLVKCIKLKEECMYWVRTIEIIFPDGKSKENTYLMCDSLEEFTEDTAGVIGSPCFWDAQIGKLTKAEAREKAKKEDTPEPLRWEKNPLLSPNVRSVMKKLGAIVSATMLQNLYGTGEEEGMREIRELIINKRVGKKFHVAKAFIPGYESIFDGTINKRVGDVVEMNSDYACAYCDIGSAYYENHDYNKAIENYSLAIRIDPNYAVAYYCRAGNYFMNGEFDNAIEDLTHYLKTDPSNEVANELLQRIKNNKND
jgi:tetratricopeptide (TPR) repeat protein